LTLLFITLFCSKPSFWDSLINREFQKINLKYWELNDHRSKLHTSGIITEALSGSLVSLNNYDSRNLFIRRFALRADEVKLHQW